MGSNHCRPKCGFTTDDINAFFFLHNCLGADTVNMSWARGWQSNSRILDCWTPLEKCCYLGSLPWPSCKALNLMFFLREAIFGKKLSRSHKKCGYKIYVVFSNWSFSFFTGYIIPSRSMGRTVLERSCSSSFNIK